MNYSNSYLSIQAANSQIDPRSDRITGRPTPVVDRKARANDFAAQAAEDSLALYWTRRDLMEFTLRIPQITQNAIRIMAERLQEIQERFRQVTTERVEQRLAHTLIRLAAQSGRKVEDGILIDLTLTRPDLAEMSGTTLYTVSRMLNQWEEQGLVLAERERVTIRNPHGLARIVEAGG